MEYKPTGITVDRKRGDLELTWNDGLVSRYPLSHLREACPCVECRGGHQFMGPQFAPEDILKLKPQRSYAIETINPVGNYAIQPIWDDGHSTGIYSWDYLRLISPEKPLEDES